MKQPRELPMFAAWRHRSLRQMRGWEFGFWLAPWPLAEQVIGRYVRALLYVECYLCLRPFVLRVAVWSDDPADRAPCPVKRS